jgi:hypothetical protein
LESPSFPPRQITDAINTTVRVAFKQQHVYVSRTLLKAGALRSATARCIVLRMTKQQHEEPTKRVMLNLPASVSDALRQAAQAKRWSMSLAGRVAVEHWLAEQDARAA